jgi:flagellar motor switch protein FliN/FliY
MADNDMEAEWAAALEEQRRMDKTAPGKDTSLGSDGASDVQEQQEENERKAQPQNDSEGVDWAAALEKQRLEEGASLKPRSEGFSAPKKFDTLPPRVEILLKIPLDVSVQLGETRMLINDLIQLGQGSIIELNNLAGKNVDLFVNGKLLGSGEVVVVNEHFGVRVSQIISPQERIKSLA